MSGNEHWEKNPEYPLLRGVCAYCNQRDDLKLSFDQIRYICLNVHACVLRWRKDREPAAPGDA